MPRKTADVAKLRPRPSNPESPKRTGRKEWGILGIGLWAGGLAAAGEGPLLGRFHNHFVPGTFGPFRLFRLKSGMDQKYLQYLDTSFKKSEDAQVKAGFQKSYKILRTLDDSGTWNLLILREYASLAALEANVEKADALNQQSDGTDEADMELYGEGRM